MIEVRDLTKIYNAKKGRSLVALDRVSFTLPDKGMVFVLGKSGSGKSTLLNLLGGLDTITEGDVIVGGNKFSDFDEQGYSSYRNNFVGFVFQEFCLIESFTVRENIVLSLNLKSDDNEDAINDVAEKLDISDLLDRYPRELSGGQKQRVAIARAIIKKPGMVLADEPTGNLDSKSAKDVLEALKKMSADNLVVVVSHNPDDAEKYGDRIIEIADGKIISDLEKNPDYISEVVVDDDEIVLPCKKEFSEEEISFINDKISSGKYKLRQTANAFVKSGSVLHADGERIQFAKHKLKAKKTLSFSYNFLKKRWLGFFVSILMVSILVMMFGLCQQFALFDENDAIESAMAKSKDDVFVLMKGRENEFIKGEIDTNGLVRVEDEEIEKFRQEGYDGNIYKLYNYCVSLSEKSYNIESQNGHSTKDMYAQFFAPETKGVLVCDEEFLLKQFANNGEIKYISKAAIQKEGGIIITDYIADALMFYQNRNYNGYNNCVGAISERAYVNAVIDTGYKEKYRDTLEEYLRLLSDNSFDTTAKLVEFHASSGYVEMIEYIDTFLNVAYSFNPNFQQDSIGYEYRRFSRVLAGTFTLENGEAYSLPRGIVCYYDRNIDIAQGEMHMGYKLYNEIFGTSLVDANDPNFVPREVVLKGYEKNTSGEQALNFELKLKVVGLKSRVGESVSMSDEDLAVVRKYDTIPYALYFDNMSDVATIINASEEMFYYANSGYFKAVKSITEIVTVFKDLFMLIAVCLCLASAIVLISFAFSNIKKHTYEIGVMRAMGASMNAIASMFVLQTALAGFIISVLTSVGLFVVTAFANNILSESFMSILQNSSLQNFDIIKFNPIAVGVDLAIVVVVTIVSAFVPLIALYRVKPLEIIRNKD